MKYEYGDIHTDENGNVTYGWYPVDGIFMDEPERDLEAEYAEWQRIIEETKDLPDIPL